MLAKLDPAALSGARNQPAIAQVPGVAVADAPAVVVETLCDPPATRIRAIYIRLYKIKRLRIGNKDRLIERLRPWYQSH